MYLDTDFPPGVRLAQFMRVASDLDQVEIGVAIDTLIARLDAAAGDPDMEDGGDDEPSGDERDASFPEWTTRRRGRIEGARDACPYAMQHEDAEDCDPGEDDGDAEDANGAEDDFMHHAFTGDQGAGCPVADGSDAAWPERMRQPDYMGGGIAGGNVEDVEPWHVAPHWSTVAIPANDTVPA